MISTGITGTARHGTSPNRASSDAGEDVAAPRAAARQDRRPGARHVRRLDRVAGRLQREIGLDRAAEIERAAVNSGQPPSSPWLGADESRDARLEAPGRCGRDNAAAGCIRPGSSRRLRARRPNGRRLLRGEQRFDGAGDRSGERRRMPCRGRRSAADRLGSADISLITLFMKGCAAAFGRSRWSSRCRPRRRSAPARRSPAGRTGPAALRQSRRR